MKKFIKRFDKNLALFNLYGKQKSYFNVSAIRLWLPRAEQKRNSENNATKGELICVYIGWNYINCAIKRHF